jgi:hypothetical protein
MHSIATTFDFDEDKGGWFWYVAPDLIEGCGPYRTKAAARKAYESYVRWLKHRAGAQS